MDCHSPKGLRNDVAGIVSLQKGKAVFNPSLRECVAFVAIYESKKPNIMDCRGRFGDIPLTPSQ